MDFKKATNCNILKYSQSPFCLDLELNILSLDIGYGATSSNQREKVASIIFRNLVIMESRYDLKFEDKAEVVFILEHLNIDNRVR